MFNLIVVGGYTLNLQHRAKQNGKKVWKPSFCIQE